MKTTYKNILNYLMVICLLTIISSTLSCKKQLAAEYNNPDGFTKPTIEGSFSNLLQQGGLFRLDYGEWYHVWSEYFNQMLSAGGVNSVSLPANINIQTDPYTGAYSKLRSARDVSIYVNQLPADQQTSYQPFLWTTSIVKDYIFYNLTDKCGSVPYVDAMKVQDAVFAPKFDSQKAIYEALLADLKDISGKLKGYQLSTSDQVALTFQQYDVLFKGNMSKWRVFANSLRMRLALRLTNVEPDLAKSTISDVLADGAYIQSAADDITIVDLDPNLTARGYNGSGAIYRTFLEQRGVLFLPQKMMEVLKKTGLPTDPRLMVLFQPDMNGNYSVMPTEGADVALISDLVTTQDITKTFPALYNRTTFETNFAMPQQIIASTEVHLIKAEAAVRWPDLGINGATEYQKAIQESIDYYYAINKLNPGGASLSLLPAAQPAKPNQSVIDAFLAAKVAEFTAASDQEKKGLISDQRFVHFNVVNEYELWADNRRLFKELGARVIRSPKNMKQMERFPYPASEAANNTNFSSVIKDNNYTTPVWWTGR
ncbi:SusD/RagB family nutrient-binding outer membrane lipoprotein [Mucilaginibacter sp. 22184]|uniref:SusD/RagB family nutrient-binding outer membrane lipoprotein n=1 Tax=Mucilaginibacter sp. 22184 TaxID=3453887 RepID=UPI003F83F455